MNFIVVNPKKLNTIKEALEKQGKESLHIVSDFDGTLTYFHNSSGQKIPSLISLLRDGNYLTPNYAQKAQALFEKYHPIETDPNLPLPEKKKLMEEWWRTHNKLLIESGLSFSDFESIVEKSSVRFRKGMGSFLDLLHFHQIPLLILSASGCGEAIPLFFEKENKNYSNIFFVVNRFVWNKNKKAVSFQEPVIHSLNKDEVIVKKIPKIYKKIKNRKNIILLGDGIGDIAMAKGFPYSNIIKIGFLNTNDDQLENLFKENFDVIIKNDGDFGKIVELLEEILNNSPQ